MDALQTEGLLQHWRNGPTQAEGLTAAVLHVEGYEGVDPQHPLGGPDGLKDVLCRRDGLKWVAACYFPPTTPEFKDIQEKFGHDAAGIKANGAEGFCFFVNQRLKISERQNLLAMSPAKNTEIYHLDRLVSLLNSARGCGVRLQYLRIPMSEAEQWAFWNEMNADVVRHLADAGRRQHEHFQTLEQKLDLVIARTNSIERKFDAIPSSLLRSSTSGQPGFPTGQLDAAMLRWVHRLLSKKDNQVLAPGEFRAVRVWIGPQGSTEETANFVPPAPETVPLLVDELLDWWRARHIELQSSGSVPVARGLADLHHRFLRIHPFLDGNGRVSRVILDQAARELLGRGVSSGLTTEPLTYIETLRKADAGDLSPLADRILASLE